MHEPICEREQLFGANIYTQLVHMILLIGTTGSLGDIKVIHLHSLIDMATVVVQLDRLINWMLHSCALLILIL